VQWGLRGYGLSGELIGDGGEEFGDLLPVVDAGVAGNGEVVGCGVEQALAVKELEVAGLIVDEEIGEEDGLVSAEDVVGGRDEGEVALQPTILGAERVGDNHGLRGYEDFEAGGEVFQDALRVGHEGEVFKEVFSVKEGAELELAVGGRDLPEPLANEVLGSDFFLEGFVVAAEMLCEGVGHYFVHVDADALH
jgi:hypothetical protein